MRGRLESWRDISVCFCLLPVLPSRLFCADELLDPRNLASLKTRCVVPASHSRRKTDAKRSSEPKTDALTKTGGHPRQFAATQPRRRGQGTVGLLQET